MRVVFFAGILLLAVLSIQTHAQTSKPVVDTAMFNSWPTLSGSGQISADGKYVCYNKREGKKNATILKDINNKWSKTFTPANNIQFSIDGKLAVYSNKDSLFFWQLGSDKHECISGVRSHEIISRPNHQWVIYATGNSDKEQILHIRNMQTHKEKSLKNIQEYYSLSGSADLFLVNNNSTGKDKPAQQTISWYDLQHETLIPALSSDQPISGIEPAPSGYQFYFTQADSAGHILRIGYYKRGMSKPEWLVSQADVQRIDSNVNIADLDWDRPQFNKNGRYLFFTVRLKNALLQTKNTSGITLWKYSEKKLPIDDIYKKVEWRWVVSLDDKKIFPCETLSGRCTESPSDLGNYALCIHEGFSWWQKDAFDSLYLISLQTGERKLIEDKINYDADYCFSPQERYIVYYNPFEHNYFSYDISSGIKKNITAGAVANWTRTTQKYSSTLFDILPVGIAGWLPNDKAVLLYSNDDIWKVDPQGVWPPVNITSGYGAAHHIQFKIADQFSSGNKQMIVKPDQSLVLFALDSATKNAGFYVKKINNKEDPLLLNMDAYAYHHRLEGSGFHLEKATHSDTWLIKRESIKQSPNLFVTTDFKTFSEISDIHPERNYNWMTSEIISWRLPDGTHAQGALYKPENFDPSKKYPVIFDYYEERSGEVNEYKDPDFAKDRMNIPYMVSREYVVVTPDINYVPGKPGEGALASVVSAAAYLATQPWVDNKHMGLQGHSYGGFETNYIITHSNLFAAACEAAGTSDIISMYGLRLSPASKPYPDHVKYYEIGQGRMDKSVGESPEAYIKSSPVLNVASVSTPLFMMHNRLDASVPWSQALEFFLGLRRLGKRVWFVEYENQGHSIGKEQFKKDYTVRMIQFFDHYLKNAPCPEWMLDDKDDLNFQLDKNTSEPVQKEVLYQGKFQQVQSR